MPSGSELFLDRRSLSTDHRALAAALAPGMSVLDVGCGSGAITRGIADAVGPTGSVVGTDINRELLDQALAATRERPNLSFRLADVARIGAQESFDVVTGSRVLQWLVDPRPALRSMVAALRPGGRLIVLDYSHTKARWEPDPPAAFSRFWDAFLDWRSEAGMDNETADHLAVLFRDLGLRNVQISDQSEITTAGDADFDTRMALWPSVIATRGHQLVADGKLSEAERAAAGEAFEQWQRAQARRQSLYLLAVSATKPLSA